MSVPQQTTDEVMRPLLYRIASRCQETADTFTMEMAPANGDRAATFSPGQFNMLYLFGVGEVPISISGDPAEHGHITHTTRAVGTVTHAMAALREGDTLGLRGPFGTAWPVETSIGDDIVIVAGGIGLAPLRPALYAILHQRERYGRVTLLYGARTPEDLLYRDELMEWRGRFDLDVHVTVDSASPDWRGHIGVVTALFRRAEFDADETTAMVCGPEIMMRFVVRELQLRGVAEERIFVSMERNMKCAVGLCGHCQFGPTFVCKDGPVFRYEQVRPFFGRAEV